MQNRMPIERYLEKGNNSFSLLRLFAAVAVVISHAWTTVGGDNVYEPLQATTGFTLGWHAVNLFFALSGLLIVGSIESGRSLMYFAWSRFLRIYPAMLVVIIFTIAVTAVFADTTLWRSNHVVEYLLRNLLLVGSSATLPGVFSDVPSPNVINVPLWTLKYEVLAYISAAFLSVLNWRYSNIFPMKFMSLTVLVACAALLIPVGTMDAYGPFEHGVRLFFAFYLGVACWHWREQVTASTIPLLVLTLIVFSLLWLNIFYAPILILWTAYFALWFGTFDAGVLKRFADRQDYSYGIYIIGYPIQQTVMAVTGIANPWFNFLITLIIVLPLAGISWNLIEKPVLALKNFDRFYYRSRMHRFFLNHRKAMLPTQVPVSLHG